jgi:hypothetical protein
MRLRLPFSNEVTNLNKIDFEILSERSGSKLLPNFLKPRRKTELRVNESGSAVGFAHHFNNSNSDSWSGQEGEESFEIHEILGQGFGRQTIIF